MMSQIILGLLMTMTACLAQAQSVYQTSEATPPPQQPAPGSYYDWGRGADGTGYCYQFSSENNQVMNGGNPVAERNCEKVSASHFDWGQSQYGYGYCFQFTPQHLVMWQGRPVPTKACEAVRPSYYAWARGSDGWTYCFQFTPYGRVLNEGRPLPNHFCEPHKR
jgi:hypothetical protein